MRPLVVNGYQEMLFLNAHQKKALTLFSFPISSTLNKQEVYILSKIPFHPSECGATQFVATQVFHEGGKRQRSSLDRR